MVSEESGKWNQNVSGSSNFIPFCTLCIVDKWSFSWAIVIRTLHPSIGQAAGRYLQTVSWYLLSWREKVSIHPSALFLHGKGILLTIASTTTFGGPTSLHLHSGHLSTFCLQFPQTVWPLPHCTVGGLKISVHTGHLILSHIPSSTSSERVCSPLLFCRKENEDNSMILCSALCLFLIYKSARY